MKTVEIKDATVGLGQYAAHISDDPVVVTDHGRPVAALVAVENADMETVSLSTNPKFIELIQRSRVRQAREGGISSAEMRRRLGIRAEQKGPSDQ